MCIPTKQMGNNKSFAVADSKVEENKKLFMFQCVKDLPYFTIITVFQQTQELTADNILQSFPT